jgi:hypothetical protein
MDPTRTRVPAPVFTNPPPAAIGDAAFTVIVQVASSCFSQESEL